MEEPLHRLTSAAVLFSDITAESSPGPELIVEGLKARRASWEVTARDISKGGNGR
jgi:hypothetical protein